MLLCQPAIDTTRYGFLVQFPLLMQDICTCVMQDISLLDMRWSREHSKSRFHGQDNSRSALGSGLASKNGPSMEGLALAMSKLTLITLVKVHTMLTWPTTQVTLIFSIIAHLQQVIKF